MDEKKRRNREDEKRVMKEDIERRRKIEKMLISVDDDDDRSQITEKEYEGRFKKSASGRKPKSKGQRMGRSKSTGNALDDFDSSSQRSRPKSPGSVRSLNLADDDIDDELDSNYTSFKRSGSKTSLYASRSSLYGRRRKNSMGETVSMSSYMHDDVDSRMGDFDKTHLSHKEKERLFKSTGDLDLSSASAVVFRECATQTGSSKEVYVYGRKTYVKSKPGKRYSRGTQKFPDKERRDSTGSARSGRSTKSNRLKSRSKSQESLRKQKGSRSRDFSDDDSEFSHRQRRKKSQDKDYSDGDVSERSHRQRRKKNHDSDDASERSHHERRKKLKDRDNSEDERSYHHSESRFSDSDQESKRSRNKLREIDNDYYKSKQKAKPNPMPRRKTHDTMTSDSSDSDDNNSQVTSSVAHAAHFAPTGYSVVYPQPGVAYMSTAPGGPPMMFPVTSMPQSAIPQKPSVAPKPNVSKWDQLVNLTEGMKKRRHQMGESVETESVLSSTWSQPVTYASQPHSHYSQSPYTMSQRMPGFVSTYPESIDSTKLPKEHIIGYSRKYASNDSNV
uniref:Uncharacterized protein n=1 Tax=Arion vulgaris TaxID=1028688 RepID=A0A0B6ZB69_9EUPU